jgi:RNA polymerase sigma-70 factor, ECF subfamily
MTDRDNTAWLQALKEPGLVREAALSDLRTLILKNLVFGLNRWISVNDPRYEALVEEVTQETLLRVLDHLDDFEDRSRFTTWVYKIAIRVALSELRRKHWENVSLDQIIENEELPSTPRLVSDPAPGPEAHSERAGIMAFVQRIMDEELSEKQRQAMFAVAVKGMPIEEAARRLGTNRNALYKLLHDARLRIKNRLAHEDLTPADILMVFESE